MGAKCVVVGEVSKPLADAIEEKLVGVAYVPTPIEFATWFQPLAKAGVARFEGSIVEVSRDFLARDWVIEGDCEALEIARRYSSRLGLLASITVPGPFTLATIATYRGRRLVENPHRATALVPLAASILSAVSDMGFGKIVLWEKTACSLCGELGARHGYSRWLIAEALSYVLDHSRGSVCVYLGPCTNPYAYEAIAEAGAKCVGVKGVKALATLLSEVGDEIEEVLLDPLPAQSVKASRLPPITPCTEVDRGADPRSVVKRIAISRELCSSLVAAPP